MSFDLYAENFTDCAALEIAGAGEFIFFHIRQSDGLAPY